MSNTKQHVKPSVLTVEEWDTTAVKYAVPKIGGKGGKSINAYSTQTGKATLIKTEKLTCWGGISDFVKVDPITKVETSDGKFKCSFKIPLNSPLHNKMLAHREQLIDDAFANVATWLPPPVKVQGKAIEYTRDMVAMMCSYPLHHPKDKDTKEEDYNKDPYLSVSVSCYPSKTEGGSGEWDIKLFDEDSNTLFPNAEGLTPPVIWPKSTETLKYPPYEVESLIQFGPIWVVDRKFGMTVKLIQAKLFPSEGMTANRDIDVGFGGGSGTSAVAKFATVKPVEPTIVKPVVRPPIPLVVEDVPDSDDDKGSDQEPVAESTLSDKPLEPVAEPIPEPIIEKPAEAVAKPKKILKKATDKK